MKKIVLALMLVCGWPIIASAKEMTAKEAAEHLSKSIVMMSNTANGKSYCTAWNIAKTVYVTAGHCTNSNGKIYVHDNNFEWARVGAITVGIGEKKSNDKPKDWGLLHTMKEVEGREPLEIDCGFKPHIGLPVAFMGFGDPTEGVLGMGYISSLSIDNGPGDAEYMISTHVSGGSSGSPVIDLTSGKVIGIVTELVPSPRVGVIGTGVEHVLKGVCEASKPHVEDMRAKSAMDAIPKEFQVDPEDMLYQGEFLGGPF